MTDGFHILDPSPIDKAIKEWEAKQVDVARNVLGLSVLVSEIVPLDEVWLTNGKEIVVIGNIGGLH